MTDSFKYYAFISYSHADFRWGKRLERKLAGFKMPATLCSERGWERKPINPIFFAPYDIQPGDLDEELKSRLRASRNLIVICSPDSAQSEWVGKEIKYFHDLGRDKNIFFFIVRGEPHSQDPKTECFNPICNELNIPEILGANIHEKVYPLPYLNRQRAYVQLVSKLLGVEFDSIWQRHKRLLLWKWIGYLLLGVLFVLSTCLAWGMSKDTTVAITSHEIFPVNNQLPPLQDMIVSISLDEETKIDTMREIGDVVLFHHVPKRYLHKPIRINISHSDFTPLFEEIDSSFVLKSDMSIPIRRDTNEYGDICVKLICRSTKLTMPHTMVIVNGDTLYTNEEGTLNYHILYSKQADGYRFYVPKYNYSDSIHMPSQENGVIIISDIQKNLKKIPL